MLFIDIHKQKALFLISLVKGYLDFTFKNSEKGLKRFIKIISDDFHLKNGKSCFILCMYYILQA